MKRIDARLEKRVKTLENFVLQFNKELQRFLAKPPAYARSSKKPSGLRVQRVSRA